MTRVQLSEWLVAEFDDTAARLRRQVLALVPAERRLEHPGGGNSILWVHFHVTRHAALALSVAAGIAADSDLFGKPFSASVPDGGGLTEAEQSWVAELSPTAVDSYFTEVSQAARNFISAVSVGQLDENPDADSVLEKARVRRDEFGWLYDMWSGQKTAFFVRWPLIGHLASHVGEMLATRNRMGLSPF